MAELQKRSIPPTSQKRRRSHQNRISADVAEWQTQATQNRSGNHVGSSPTIGTKKQSGLFQVPDCFVFVASHTFVFSGKMPTMALAEDTLLEKSRWV